MKTIGELRVIISEGVINCGYGNAALDLWRMGDREFVRMIPVWTDLFGFVDSGLAAYLDSVYPMIRG